MQLHLCVTWFRVKHQDICILNVILCRSHIFEGLFGLHCMMLFVLVIRHVFLGFVCLLGEVLGQDLHIRHKFPSLCSFQFVVHYHPSINPVQLKERR